MTPERWEHVCEILEKTLSLKGQDRELYLADACTNDPDLRREVESLLASHDQAGSRFLNVDPLATDGLQDDLQPTSVRVGRRIGPYLVVEEIGRGGMGEVYAAVRADGQYEQRVALKLVRSGYDTQSMIERFHNERQILAGLNHPDIARLLDGGTTEDGVPYLVMELVNGARIDSYCDAKKLSVTDRLQLFLRICSAVQYAHQRLVIHRDIKSGNILVTQDGTPKLLDFSIAKTLDASGNVEATVLRPMTPEYASPEQVRGEPITTATDVYSLGVVLYQLLTGRSPYRVKAHTPEKLAQAIANDEPERPSTSVHRVTTGAAHGADVPELSPEAVSSTREASPLRLERRLRGDLDYILLKALRKEPEKRYSSVEQFAEDIRRHLEGLPVTARKGTWSYRSGKFIRRNRIGMGAAALVLLTLVAGAVVVVREAHIADANRRRAEARFNDVRKLANSLIFEIHDSIQDVPGTTRARKLLASRAIEYLDALSRESGGDPSLQRELAAAYKRIGDVQGSPYSANLGDVPAALESYKKARSIRQSLYASKSRTLDDDVGLAEASRLVAETLLVSSKTSEAFENSKYSVEIAEQEAQNHPNDLTVLRELRRDYETQASILAGNFNSSNLAQPALAIEVKRKEVSAAEHVARLAPDDPSARIELIISQTMLGDLFLLEGRVREARSMYKQSDRAFGDSDSILQSSRANSFRNGLYTRLSFVDLWSGDISQAITTGRRALRFALKYDRADAGSTAARLYVAEDYANLADAVSQSKSPEQAIPSVNRAIEIIRQLVSLHPKDTEYLGNEAAVYVTAGDVARRNRDARRALDYYRDAAALFSKLQSEDPQNRDNFMSWAASCNEVAQMQAQLGDLSGALATYNESLKLVRSDAESEQPNEESLYTAADAFAGLAEVESKFARRSVQGSNAQREHWGNARNWNELSLKMWRRVREPGALSPHGFYCVSPSAVSRRLAECKSELARFEAAPDHAAPLLTR
jgi:serine/threonine protein kinase/tetratricopeptide (TPR) repeat protein